MEKISERIGLYDLWVTFFPGTIGAICIVLLLGMYKYVSAFTYNLDKFTDYLITFIPANTSEWCLFILCSFFVGIVLQEIGRLLKIKLKLNNAADGLFDEKKGVFSSQEIKKLKTQKYGGDSKAAFHYLNTVAQKAGIAEKYAKLSVLQNMSLSLASAMLLGTIGGGVLFVISIVKKSFHGGLLSGIAIVLCIFLLALFLKRSERFNRYWVRSIVYAAALEKEKD